MRKRTLEPRGMVKVTEGINVVGEGEVNINSATFVKVAVFLERFIYNQRSLAGYNI